MKICIYGASAIGGTLGVRLAQAGREVSRIARGAHHDAICANGLTLLRDGKRASRKLPASTVGEPFAGAEHNCIAFRMLDDRGNELIDVKELI